MKRGELAGLRALQRERGNSGWEVQGDEWGEGELGKGEEQVGERRKKKGGTEGVCGRESNIVGIKLMGKKND